MPNTVIKLIQTALNYGISTVNYNNLTVFANRNKIGLCNVVVVE